LASFGRDREGWWQGQFGAQPARARSSSWLLRGGHGRSAGERLGAMQGAATPLWRPARMPATDDPTATLLGVSVGLGRCERQRSHGTNRWSAGRSRPDGARREEEGGRTSRPSWDARGFGERASGRREGLGRRGGRTRRARAGTRERRATSRSGLKMFRTGPVQARFSPKI
jgi:hypothetical protein